MALLVGELYALLLLEKKAFMKGLKEAEAAAVGSSRTMGQSFMAAGKMIAVGLAVAVVGIAAFAAAGLSASTEFEQGMARIQTLIGTGSAVDKRIGELGEDVKAMSKVTGKSLKDLQAGLYDVIGTFTDTADSAAKLELAAKAGAAGMSTTREAIRLLAAITKSYGDTSMEATQKAADLVFETANLGVTTFPEMAASMGKVLPISAALKVSQEELFGAMATLTGVTGDTAEVTTQLRSIMSAFLKPNTLMNKAIKETGYVSGTAMVQQLGLSGAMKLIGGTAVVADKGIAKVFGRVEALTAVLALNGAQAQDWVWKTEAMKDSAGRTARAFEIQQKTASAIIDRIGAGLAVMAVNMGNKMMPAFKDFLSWVEEHLPEIEAIVLGAVDAISKGFGILATVVSTTVGAIMGAWNFLGDIKAQGAVIEAVLLAIAVAFGVWAVAAAAAAIGTIIAFAPVILTIAAVAAAIFMLEKIFEMMGTSIGEVVSDMVAFVGEMFKQLIGFVLTVAGTIVGVIAALPGPLQEGAKAMQATLDGMKEDVAKWGTGMQGLAQNAGEEVGKGVSEGMRQSLNTSEIGDTYNKTGVNAGEQLLAGLGGTITEGMSLTEAQLEDLGISADDALAAGINVGEGSVIDAALGVVSRFGTSMEGVIFAASEVGGAAMSELAKGILDARDLPVAALNTLKEMLKNAMSPAKERMRLIGILMSKTLAKGMKSSDPAVRAQAEATKKLAIERLQTMIDEGKPLGKKAIAAINKGIKSKDPDIRATAKHAKKVLIDGLRPVVGQAGSLGTRAGDAFRTAFANAARRQINLHMNLNVGGYERGVQQYATGSWRIPKNQLAFIHQGEMVVPAAAANRIREAASAGGYDQLAGQSGASGGRQEIHNHLTVTGLVKARTPFEILKQQQRLHDFGVLRWPQSSEVVA